MQRPPFSVRITLILILINSAVWLVFALLMTFNLIRSLPSEGLIKWAMVVLSISVSGVLFSVVIFLRKRNALAYHFAVILLGFMASLSILDDFGLPDLVMFLVSLITFGLLIKERAWYLQNEHDNGRKFQDI